MTGRVAYWHVEDVRSSVRALPGGQVQQEIRDAGGGRLVATVTDPDGNLIGLLQPEWGEQTRDRRSRR
jgi:predicted enzyme related to lactoylglutathione lyase